MIKVVIDYRYTREVNRDSAHHKMELDIVDFDFDLVDKIYEVLDDYGYTVEHVNMSEEVVFP